MFSLNLAMKSAIPDSNITKSDTQVLTLHAIPTVKICEISKRRRNFESFKRLTIEKNTQNIYRAPSKLTQALYARMQN